MADLSELIAYTAEAAPYTAENYPQLASLKGEDAFAFMLTHSLRHTAKSSGRMNTLLEAYDHGELSALDRAALEKEAVKFVFNALRIVEVLGMSGEDVSERMRSEFKSRN